MATNVQDHRPPAFQVQAPPKKPWSTGLFDCFDDPGNCFLTCCFPCITFGEIAEITDRGSTSCGEAGICYALLQISTGCAWIYSYGYRTTLREQYSLQEEPCDDLVVHWCCDRCALCQEYRELQNRGFDVALGWQWNMERMQAAGMATAPPAPVAGMNRR